MADGPPRGDAQRARILRYWRAVEMFSAAPAPRPGPDGEVVRLEGDRPAPWEMEPRGEPLGERRVRRHAVHLGLFSLAEAYGLLERAFPDDFGRGEGPRVRGESATVAFVADEHGRPLPGSLVLSECAWAIAQALSPGATADSGDGFAAAHQAIADVLGEGGDEPMTGTRMAHVAQAAGALTGVDRHLAIGGTLVRSYHIDRADAQDGRESVLLNGFHGDDLRRVEAAVRRGDYGHALWRYLAPTDEFVPPGRLDLADPVGAREIERFLPAARWPAPVDRPPEDGQRWAVAGALGRLGHGGGIVAVNGPPGTGKTTMLRDLIAAIVVERARALADLDRPADAFVGRTRWSPASEGERWVHRLRPSLTGHEIVLACSTNAAAENVSVEIPARTAIGEEWHARAAHLAGLGTLALRARQEATGGDVGADRTEAWGLLAACLGSRRRTADFARAVWWGSLPSDRRARREGQLALAVPETDPRPPGLARLLREAAARTDSRPTWREAVDAFRAARDAARAEMGDPSPEGTAHREGLRTEVFLGALALHRALLEHAAGAMGDNLRAVADLLGGRAPAGVSTTALASAWQSLFLVVPVVSTTFASVPRLFDRLEREAFGWLLIDEAAQVPPWHAVGALWRARRVVAVGDPRQLEPIDALPTAIHDRLRAREEVPADWAPAAASVQTLADRVSAVGARAPEASDGWIGVPLTGHRRCQEPMFTIINRLAYGGRMVNLTSQDRGPDLPESAWLDVPPGGADGHWRPAEGERLTRVLLFLERAGQDPREVALLSPFRDVAHRLVIAARGWPGVRAGTVHTAQGREADVVVLVLGSDPANDGARRWAADRPNLLNVAVSRARRRLWVIGDLEAWSAHPNVALIGAHLPRWSQPVRARSLADR